jgi:hypothetical protein
MWWAIYSETRVPGKSYYSDIHFKGAHCSVNGTETLSKNIFPWSTIQAVSDFSSKQHSASRLRNENSWLTRCAKSYKRWTWPAPDPVYFIFHRTRLHVKCHLHCSTYKAQEHSNPLHFHVKQFHIAGDCNVLWSSHRQYLLIEQKFRWNKALGFWVTDDPSSIINIKDVELSVSVLQTPGIFLKQTVLK